MTKANKELEDGSFEVRIPLSEKLKGKDLVAYYVDDNGNKEEHEVTIKDGYAVFNTNHFSTYTLAEKPAEKPDKTPDETPIETPIHQKVMIIQIMKMKKMKHQKQEQEF